jgi:hypothetical protein
MVYLFSWNSFCVRNTHICFQNTSSLAVLTAPTEISDVRLYVLRLDIIVVNRLVVSRLVQRKYFFVTSKEKCFFDFQAQLV